MADFLLELLSEEIPARMQAKARVDLERLFVGQMDEAGLKASDITVYSTPRRLALIAKNLPEQTEAISEEAKGPPESAPDQAVDGFCRKNGVTRDQLEVRDVKGRPTLFAVINKPGRDTMDVLAAAIPAIIKAFPWPKSMRWGDASQSTESLRWVRPLSGIVALLGDDLIECEIDGVISGFETVGHRFHHEGMITIGNAADYAAKLRAGHVLVDHEKRQDIVRDGAKKAASDGGLVLVEDEGLVIENAGLTEWPVPLLGSFDPAFLDVPEEVIQLTARVNQKYFICRDQSGKLAPNFVCTANIEATDGGKAIAAGNEKVLAARLSDAKFFWELDQKTSLEEHSKKLSNIVFHEKLGTVADKVERVAKLAEWLVSLEGNGFYQSSPGDTLHGEVSEAARLCKADLVTEMVGEFPDLQGLMGGYYAEKQGLPEAVSNAIRDHYKPVGQGDDVPTDPVTVCVSLADKLDTLVGFFAIDEKPTGSKDPFALRRAALAVIRLIVENDIRIGLSSLLLMSSYFHFCQKEDNTQIEIFDELLDDLYDTSGPGISSLSYYSEQQGYSESKRSLAGLMRKQIDTLIDFLFDRLRVQQKEAGVRHDLIDAAVARGNEDNLIHLLERIKVLQNFVETEDGKNLLAGYKRAANVVKKWQSKPDLETAELEKRFMGIIETDKHIEGLTEAFFNYSKQGEEVALEKALNRAQEKAVTAFASENYEKVLSLMSGLREPVDSFLENVMVNDEDPLKRLYRMTLLLRFTKQAYVVADFSKIEG
ncbi:glycine--tRNA ligase subunit beta [Parasphingorhabdus sp.]|uniref:glycine--tRNA ligase subunit beta n=1 Tax=Parasphingorhabdus sp. TaxID=2709688 RepID=UPI003266034C